MSKKKNNLDLTVLELFAGVGGFRLGLEKTGWRVVWANQWEPLTKVQYAAECYKAHFGNKDFSNEDIAKVPVSHIPKHTLLTGGFPCQDYSVAATNAKGIEGKKGVLWWEIYRILKAKKPPFVLLENVDRLLVSPAKQRGRDMGVMLACFRDLGYSVEWRIINAADYGFPQRRRRIFIFGFKNTTKFAKRFYKSKSWNFWLQKEGFFAHEFPVKEDNILDLKIQTPLEGTLLEISNNFKYKFSNTGILSKYGIFTKKITPIKEKMSPLSSVLEEKVNEYFYIPNADIAAWKYAKGAKNELRVTKAGYEYNYKEGAIPFPDNLDMPSRTLLTKEGNKRPSRCTHIIKEPNKKKLRILTPVETERLDGFPDNWTDTGMPLSWRYFCMGNVLVVGLIERISKGLKEVVKLER